MSLEQILTLIQNVGFPGFCLLMFTYGIWRVMSWVGREVIIPARDRGLTKLEAVFDRMARTLDTVDENLGQMTVTLREQSELITRQSQVIQEMSEEMRSWRNSCEDVRIYLKHNDHINRQHRDQHRDNQPPVSAKE